MDDHLPTIEEQIAAINGSPTLGEEMNAGLALDPALSVHRPGLIESIEGEIDDTVARAKAARTGRGQDGAEAS